MGRHLRVLPPRDGVLFFRSVSCTERVPSRWPASKAVIDNGIERRRRVRWVDIVGQTGGQTGLPAVLVRILASLMAMTASFVSACPLVGAPPAFAASYRAQVQMTLEDSEVVALDHSLRLPFTVLGTPFPGRFSGELSLHHRTVPGTGVAQWGGTFAMATDSWRWYVTRDQDHRSSTEPFRLVHRATRSPEAWAGGLQRLGPWSALLQYVQAVPLRGENGPLLLGQVSGPWPWPRFTWVGYGTWQLQHHFFVLDGGLRLSPTSAFIWGGAWQQGVEAATREGRPAWTTVAETAAFARLEAVRDRHRFWLVLHGTSPGFRSLVASTYPFKRGRAGLEGRWQFRPQTNHLLSVYGHVTEPLGEGYRRVRDVEMRYSVSPRRRWAWHVGAAAAWEEDGRPTFTWQVGVRDPGRFLDASVEMVTDGGELRWRPRLEWNTRDWRLRVSADTGFPGWRVQWGHTGHPLWALTVVYKRRWDDGDGTSMRDWTYVRVARRLEGLGDVWVRWGDEDRGRLDVGWSRPQTLAIGIDVFF